MAKDDGSIWSKWQTMFVLFIVIVALVIAGAYTSYAILASPQSGAEPGLHVQTGDTVTVDYIGMFADGTVFDTSILTVAENNTLYPKSLAFEERSSYSPLNFTVGSGQMIAGFESGVIGMALGQTKTIEIPPEQGYGSPDESLIIERNLTFSVPVYQWVGNSTDFKQTYEVQPYVGANVKNSLYGWNMTVYHIDPTSGEIMVKNNPIMGEIVSMPEGWSSRVIGIDTSANSGLGQITVQHLISESNVNKIMYTDPSSGIPFLITAVDTSSGTYTADYNREVVGKTLVFKITLLTVTPAE